MLSGASTEKLAPRPGTTSTVALPRAARNTLYRKIKRHRIPLERN